MTGRASSHDQNAAEYSRWCGAAPVGDMRPSDDLELQMREQS